MQTEKPIPNTLEIQAYIHCGLCLQEQKNNEALHTTMSPKDYQRIQVGFTKLGLQVWCTRHDCNIMHVDFEHQKHPANTTRLPNGT
jgi:hypothetical protein